MTTTYNLPALDSTHALTEAMTVASTVNQPTEDYSNYIGTAEIDLSLSDAKSLFKIHSDSKDVTEDTVANDFAIKLNNANWPDVNLSTRDVDADDRAENVGTDQTVAKNYVRQLAKDFLDVSGGVDIFSNEASLASEVTNADVSLNAAIVANLGTNDASVAIGTSDAVSSELFAQKYGAATGDTSWLEDFASDFASATATDGVYELEFPFVAGDKLVFGVKYTRADTTLGGISKTAAELEQKYKVTINITA